MKRPLWHELQNKNKWYNQDYITKKCLLSEVTTLVEQLYTRKTSIHITRKVFENVSGGAEVT